MREIIRPFFATVIVGVDSDSTECRVYASYYKFKKLIGQESKNFPSQAGEVPPDALRYIKKIKTANPFTYVAVLTQTLVQGVLPTTKVKDFQKYGINPNTINYIPMKTWSLYIAQDAINDTQKSFTTLGGVDFLFSPFALLYELAKTKLAANPRVYVLLEQSNMTLLVAKENVLFGAFFLLSSDSPAPTHASGEIKIPSKTGKAKAKESDTEVLADATSEIDNIGSGLDDLDDSLLDSFDDKGGDTKTAASDAPAADFHADKGGFGDFARISKAAGYIQQALNEFYTSEVYQSEFISEVFLFDGGDFTPDVLEHIKTITLLELQVFPCNIAQGVSLLGFQAFVAGNRRR